MKKEKNPTLGSIDQKIDDLASAMVNYSTSIEKRFDQTDQKIEIEIRSVRAEIRTETQSVKAEIRLGIAELKTDIEKLDERISGLENQSRSNIDLLFEEQEKIKTRLKKLELKNSHG